MDTGRCSISSLATADSHQNRMLRQHFMVLKNNYMNNGKILLGVVAGIVTGAALGLLLAPDKGSSTRRKISRRSQYLADSVNEKMEEKFEELLGAIGRLVKKNKPENDFVKTSKSQMAD